MSTAHTAGVPLSVLVIDTSRQLRAMMARAVAGCGLPIAEVHQVADGQSGLDFMHHHHIDVVVCDPDMPVLDAEHLIVALRSEAELSGTCVVVASLDGASPRSGRLRALGAQIVHKPFRGEELEQAVQTGRNGRMPSLDNKGIAPCVP